MQRFIIVANPRSTSVTWRVIFGSEDIIYFEPSSNFILQGLLCCPVYVRLLLRLSYHQSCCRYSVSSTMGDPSHPADAIELRDPHGLLQGELGHSGDSSTNGRLEGSETPPEHAVSALPAWNQNKANVFKTFSTFVAFIIMGANDAAYGVSLTFSTCEAGNMC
jgi:hypothetical protein